MDEELKALTELLYDTGRRMCADAARSTRLPTPQRDFLHSWGRLLKESGLWMEAQSAAGILSPQDIVQVVQLAVDMAQTYREPSPV